MLRLEQLAPTVWAVFGEQEPDAAKAFVRFQEYYENVELKGKKGLFVSDIDHWHKINCGDDEPYYTSWAGFNVPGKVILDLVRTPEFRPGFSLTKFLLNPRMYPRWHKQEDLFLSLLENLSLEQISDGYFIGMWDKGEDVLEHEVAHAFFATVPSYRAEQMLNIGEFPSELYQEMSTKIISMGYHVDVVYDEIQAYLSTYPHTLESIFDTDKYNDYTHPFAETFQRYRTKPS